MRTRRDQTYIRTSAKKLKAINLLGSKCADCGDTQKTHLDFHHTSDKDKEISNIWDNRWTEIFPEISKCELLCSNCHRDRHTTGGRNYNLKEEFINLHNLTSCSKCGYDKCIGSLDFHHIGEKKFGISHAIMRKVIVTPEEILHEISQCIVLCSNCHRDEHFDSERYKLNEKEILDKVKNLKEIQTKISRQEVQNMLDSGMKQIEIARHFNASKGTISGIVKELKN